MIIPGSNSNNGKIIFNRYETIVIIQKVKLYFIQTL